MYALLDLYAVPYREREPVVCIDEKSKQLLKELRPPLPFKPKITSTSGRVRATSLWPSNPRANGESWK
jgi:hypothetical protein